MMKKTVSIGIVSLFAIGGLFGILSIIPEDVGAPGPTYVSGFVSEDTVWIIDNSPYIVTGDIIVEQNINLTINSNNLKEPPIFGMLVFIDCNLSISDNCIDFSSITDADDTDTNMKAISIAHIHNIVFFIFMMIIIIYYLSNNI